MRIIQNTKPLRVLSGLLFIFSISNAHAEKIKLVCNVDVVMEYSTGQTDRSREKIQVDIESINDNTFIFANGVETGFSMTTKPTKTNPEVTDSSDIDTFEIDVKHAPKAVGSPAISEYLKLDRNTGMLFYRFVGRLTQTTTGNCSKIDPKKRAF